jgi:signal transduction histidine kinase
MPVSPTELWRRVNHCLEGREVVDLQPVRLEAESSLEHDPAEAQMMLMLHDIRGSMVSAAASLKLLARGTYGEMSPNARAKLRGVAARIERTINLTENFIGKAVGNHRLGGRERDVLDLTKDVVEPILAELATEIQDHQISLVNRLPDQLGGKIPVRGSKLWLQCVFRNLINNGIKYGGRGSTIVIYFETYGPNCRLNVYNTGKTVPEAYRSMLFSYDGPRMRRSNKSRQGLGLGLSLCRDIIQNQGGDIWYEAKSDGSNFVVTLPQN